MAQILSHFGIAIFGLLTSVSVAMIHSVIAKATGYNIFSISVWIIIPVGALACGFLAASGYFFGAVWLNRRAKPSLALQMVLIAAFTQWLIYWHEYRSLSFENGIRISTIIPFAEYLKVLLTSSHISVGRSLRDVGSVGSMGYGFAFIQFIGLLIGSLSVYVLLKEKAFCTQCDLYLHTLGKKKIREFNSHQEAETYYNHVFDKPVDSPEFKYLMQLEPKIGPPHDGAISISTHLLGCPQCKKQEINERVQIFQEKKGWTTASDFDRTISLPAGLNLRRLFQ